MNEEIIVPKASFDILKTLLDSLLDITTQGINSLDTKIVALEARVQALETKEVI